MCVPLVVLVYRNTNHDIEGVTFEIHWHFFIPKNYSSRLLAHIGIIRTLRMFHSSFMNFLSFVFSPGRYLIIVSGQLNGVPCVLPPIVPIWVLWNLFQILSLSQLLLQLVMYSFVGSTFSKFFLFHHCYFVSFIRIWGWFFFQGSSCSSMYLFPSVGPGLLILDVNKFFPISVFTAGLVPSSQHLNYSATD